MLRFVLTCAVAVVVQACGISPGGGDAIPSSEVNPTNLHRSYTALYNEGLDTNEYTAEFSRRDSGEPVYIQGSNKVTVNGSALESALGAKNGLYSLKSNDEYFGDEVVFRWTDHSDTLEPDTFSGLLELTPVENKIRFRRGQDLVIRLQGPREIPREETLTGMLINDRGDRILATKVTPKRATFTWDSIRKLTNTGWVFYAERTREIEQEEIKSAGLMGTASFTSVYRSRQVPVVR